MRNFFNTRFQDMTIGQSFVWIVLYMIFMVVVMIAMILIPQNAEQIWDWLESKFMKFKAKFLTKEKPIVEEF